MTFFKLIKMLLAHKAWYLRGPSELLEVAYRDSDYWFFAQHHCISLKLGHETVYTPSLLGWCIIGPLAAILTSRLRIS